MCKRLGSLCQRWGTVAVLFLCWTATPLGGWAAPWNSDSSADDQKYWLFLAERPTETALSSRAHWTRPVASSYLSKLRSLGVDVARRSRWFHAVSAELPPSLRARVSELSFVRRMRPVASLHPQSERSRPPDSSSEHRVRSEMDLRLGDSRGPLSRINAVAPLNRGLDGHGVRLGFIDATFGRLRHPAFDALRRDDRLGGLRAFITGRQSGNHGAAVASVAMGSDPGSLVGPARGATLFGATTEVTRYERSVEEDNFVAGLEWLYRQGADVVNVSVGYTRFDSDEHSYSPDDLDGDTALTTRAVDRAAHLGVTVVVSAGNSSCEHPENCWFYVGTPADADSAITVGAMQPDSSVASFSGKGPTADGRRKPDVVAQGSDVVAAWGDNGYARVDGTSFAAPQVAGIAALMLQMNPTLTPMEVRQLLRTTASQADAPDPERGWGVVDAEAAIRAAEWRARKNPPRSLRVSSPYHPEGSDALTVPVRAPAGTSTLRVSLFTPLGDRAHRSVHVAHPGPNRLALETKTLPVGRYRYVIHTDAGHRKTGVVSLTD